MLSGRSGQQYQIPPTGVTNPPVSVQVVRIQTNQCVLSFFAMCRLGGGRVDKP